MILLSIVFLAGVLTILSPCILPVLPFVFARSDRRFVSSGLPMLAGMAVTFAGIATLAAVGGAWAVRVNHYGRVLALIMLAVFAATLLSQRLSDLLARPFIALGNRLTPVGADDNGLLASLLLGVATGLLWAPCAGPVLGLVLTGAAISGPNAHTTALLFAYAAGAATSLGIALLAGGRVFAALKRSLGAGEWIRRGLGIAVLLAVVAIALGWDDSVLTRLSLSGTNRLEQSLLNHVNPAQVADAGAASGAAAATATSAGAAPAAGTPPAAAGDGAAALALPVGPDMPSLAGATAWLNSKALSVQELRGKVVLVDFWTYSCINCLRALPYVRHWYDKYKDHGLVVIGVHAPEFAFEKDADNVAQAVRNLNVSYPVALDNAYAIWRGFDNHYWPAHYFIDAQGRIRGHHFGEGDYEGSEAALRQLLIEAGNTNLPPSDRAVTATGIEAAPDMAHNESDETYLGYRRAAGFRGAATRAAGDGSSGLKRDRAQNYSVPAVLKVNEWALGGRWLVDAEKVTLQGAPGRIVFRFHARDLHLVLGTAAGVSRGTAGGPVRFRVLLDGAAPGENHGADTDANGNGEVNDHRLYQLIRQSGSVIEHEFSIEFLDDGVQAYSFTFG